MDPGYSHCALFANRPPKNRHIQFKTPMERPVPNEKRLDKFTKLSDPNPNKSSKPDEIGAGA
uniref:Uncharacterized protein n=1 Tax=Romanomermis culicivorax TaxID=13658 RepID=A0A915LEQ7_ROMCU